MAKKEPMTLPTTTSKKESTTMSASSKTAKDIKKTNEPGSFSEKMQALLLQAEKEEQDRLDALENSTPSQDADGKVTVHPDDMVITRPPSYGKLIADCLNYG